MWNPKSDLLNAKEEAERLGHKLQVFDPSQTVPGAAWEWTAVCDFCGRSCTVVRYGEADDAVLRQGEALAEPCHPSGGGPNGGVPAAEPRRPAGSVNVGFCQSRRAA